VRKDWTVAKLAIGKLNLSIFLSTWQFLLLRGFESVFLALREPDGSKNIFSPLLQPLKKFFFAVFRLSEY
jgi:hypothetical protein